MTRCGYGDPVTDEVDPAGSRPQDTAPRAQSEAGETAGLGTGAEPETEHATGAGGEATAEAEVTEQAAELEVTEQPAEPEETAEPQPEPEPEPEPLEVGPEVRLAQEANPAYVRRAPRFGAFVFVALFLAALIAGVASFVRDAFLPPEELVGRALDSGGMFLLLFLILASFFSLAAYGLAVVLDRRSVRRMLAAREAAGLDATDWPAVPDLSARIGRRRRRRGPRTDAESAR